MEPSAEFVNIMRILLEDDTKDINEVKSSNSSVEANMEPSAKFVNDMRSLLENDTNDFIKIKFCNSPPVGEMEPSASCKPSAKTKMEKSLSLLQSLRRSLLPSMDKDHDDIMNTELSDLSPEPEMEPSANSENMEESRVEKVQNYIRKVKLRFREQPYIYREFLHTLSSYRRDQRNLRDGVRALFGPTTEADVLARAAELFGNEEDLLKDLKTVLKELRCFHISDSKL